MRLLEPNKLNTYFLYFSDVMSIDWSILEDYKYREAVRKCIKGIEELKKKYSNFYGFESIEVGVPPWILRKLVEAGILKVTYKSSKHTCYDFAVSQSEVLEKISVEDIVSRAETSRIPEEYKVSEIPDDFWAPVYGYDDLKELFLASIKADKPVHLLLVGPPSTAKSLILNEIERLKGSAFITMGTSTKAGIRDILLERRPKYLIIDEIDKISDAKDVGVLLTLMESHRIVVAKHGVHVDEELKTWVFAACNRIDRIPPELLDRFRRIHLKPYDRETLEKVIIKCLTIREGAPEDLATYIAKIVAEQNGSPRDAIGIYWMCRNYENPKEAASKFLKTLIKYKRWNSY